MAEDVVRGTVVTNGSIVPGRPARGVVLTVEEQEISRDRQIALARQRAKAELAEHGNALLTELYVSTTATFQDGVTTVAAATRAIEDDTAFAACENFNRGMTGDLGTALQQNFRNTAEHVAVTIDSFTPSRPLPPRVERVVELRDLSWRERFCGRAVLAQDRLVEDGA
jgi:hypothetical protein